MKRKWLICSLILVFSLFIGGCSLFEKDEDKTSQSQDSDNGSLLDKEKEEPSDDTSGGEPVDEEEEEVSGGGSSGGSTIPTKPSGSIPEHVLN